MGVAQDGCRSRMGAKRIEACTEPNMLSWPTWKSKGVPSGVCGQQLGAATAIGLKSSNSRQPTRS